MIRGCHDHVKNVFSKWEEVHPKDNVRTWNMYVNGTIIEKYLPTRSMVTGVLAHQ